MKIHHLGVEEALASLQSGPRGLAEAEAKRRLREFGPNWVEPVAGRSLSASFVQGLVHFFALILWAAAALAFLAECFDPNQGMATLGWAIIGVILVNNAFSVWQQYRAEKTLAALQQLLPDDVSVLREGREKIIPVTQLVPGDLVLLELGDNVPADCRLIEGFGLRVNNATITGESEPHLRHPDRCVEEDYRFSRNILLAGTSVVAGEGKAVVFATGAHSAFGEIARLSQSAKESVSPLQREIAHLSRWIALLALVLGGSFFLIGERIGFSFWQSFIFAIGIIVANVPEGLLPTVTLALALGAQRMAKRKALVRNLPAVETLGCATVICTDKTGTLTENKMVAAQLWLGGQLLDVPSASSLGGLGSRHPKFFETALFCESLRDATAPAGQQICGDPLEVALLEMARQAIAQPVPGRRISEIAFDSERKRLSTVYETGQGLILYLKGAPEVVLPLCREISTGAAARPLHEQERARCEEAAEALAESGLRVLALAWRPLGDGYDPARLEEGLVLAGLVGLKDPPRVEVPGAIEKCRRAGIRVIMVTGDHPKTARAIARQIGIVQHERPLLLTGAELERISDTQLQLMLDAPEIIFARATPEQKMRVVTALKRKGHVVAVTGDGVNDAPALKRADIGIAMGASGTDVARESADIVLLDDNFATIVDAIEEGRAVFSNIRKFMTYILTSNIPEIVPYLAFALFRIPLPLTVVQILAVDLGTDMVPALALGAEPPDPAVLRRPPRRLGERLLRPGLILRAYCWLGLLQAFAALAAFFFVLQCGGWQPEMSLGRSDRLYLQATTACFSAIVLMQVVNVFLCRHRRRSLFHSDLLSNKFIFGGIGVELLLLWFVVYTPVGNQLFATAPLSPAVWLFILPFAGGLLALEEGRKWMVRRVWPTPPGEAPAE